MGKGWGEGKGRERTNPNEIYDAMFRVAIKECFNGRIGDSEDFVPSVGSNGHAYGVDFVVLFHGFHSRAFDGEGGAVDGAVGVGGKFGEFREHL